MLSVWAGLCSYNDIHNFVYSRISFRAQDGTPQSGRARFLCGAKEQCKLSCSPLAEANSVLLVRGVGGRMRVSVAFHSVTVLVPCGDGSCTVRELIEKAIVRYKECINKVRRKVAGGLLCACRQNVRSQL